MNNPCDFCLLLLYSHEVESMGDHRKLYIPGGSKIKVISTKLHSLEDTVSYGKDRGFKNFGTGLRFIGNIWCLGTLDVTPLW